MVEKSGVSSSHHVVCCTNSRGALPYVAESDVLAVPRHCLSSTTGLLSVHHFPPWRTPCAHPCLTAAGAATQEPRQHCPRSMNQVPCGAA